MMPRKKFHLLGLDIGTSAIKLARIFSAGVQINLDTFAVAPTPLGAVHQGRILEMDALAHAVSTLLDQAGIREKLVAMAVGRTAAMIKCFPLFNASDSELDEIVFAQAEQYFPYGLDMLNLDYHIIGSDASGEAYALTAAVKKEWVQERVELADMTGLHLAVLDVEAFVLGNIHERLQFSGEKSNREIHGEKVILLVDMGEEGCTLTFLAGQKPLVVRENMAGAWQILQQMQSVMGIGREQARQLLKDKHFTRTKEQEAVYMEILQDALSGWCVEIQDQIRFFHDEYSHMNVQKIFLSGGGALVPGFQKNLESWLKVQVDLMNPFEGMNLDHVRFFPSADSISASQAAIALGLALRKSGDK